MKELNGFINAVVRKIQKLIVYCIIGLVFVGGSDYSFSLTKLKRNAFSTMNLIKTIAVVKQIKGIIR